MDHERIDNTHIPYIKAAMTRVVKSSPLVPAAIKLRQWLMDNQMTVPQLAIRTSFHPSTYYNLIAGTPAKSYPSLCQAFAIEYVTDGKVKAWEWLDNPIITHKVRKSQLSQVTHLETRIKDFVLKYKSLETNEGMIRHKARILSRLFGVEWGEVKSRVWADARERAKADRKDIGYLLEKEYEEQDES